jgi:hypothetical protein
LDEARMREVRGETHVLEAGRLRARGRSEEDEEGEGESADDHG